MNTGCFEFCRRDIFSDKTNERQKGFRSENDKTVLSLFLFLPYNTALGNDPERRKKIWIWNRIIWIRKGQ